MSQRTDWLRWTPRTPPSAGTKAHGLPPTDRTDKTDETPPPATFVSSVSGVSVGCPVSKTAPAPDPVEGRAAVGLLNRAGAKILPHHLQTIAVAAHHDTPELRRALALLGYGGYKVAHLDREYRGESIDVVEAALRAAGGLPC